MKVIGLTGGIGSGKSTVSNFFRELGAIIIDADKITHQIYDLDSSLGKILTDKFGKEILSLSKDQKIDRKKLAKIVFSDPQKRKELEAILHPLIRKEIQRQIDEAKKLNPPLIIVDAALLIETGFYKSFEGVIVVKTTAEQQIERLVKRDSFSAEEVKKRMKAQMSVEEKIKFADWIVDNSKNLSETKQAVKKLFYEITQ